MTGPKRVTEKQLAANRANAQRSTGPRSAQGKARSRWNALTHGVLARGVVPEWSTMAESREEFMALLATMRDELAPATALEELLVERIATSYWRMGRLLRAESATIAEQQRLRTNRDNTLEIISALRFPPGPPTLADRVELLSAARDDPQKLRATMVQEDPRWSSSSDEDLRAAALALLAALEAKLADEQARLQASRSELGSIPPLSEAIQFARYEAALERQLYRALDALERLQRRRLGDFVPPPIAISVDALPDEPPHE